MNQRKFLLALATGVALIAAPTYGATSLAVNTGSALEGSFGLQVSFDGAGGNAYVQDNSPNNETEYWAVFRINDTNINLDPGDSFQVMRAFIDDAATGTAFRVTLVPASPTNQRLFVLPWLDGQVAHPVGSETFVTTAAAPPNNNKFVFEWNAGTGAGNGQLKTYRDGILRKTISNVDNDTIRVGMIRMGGFGNTISVPAGSVLRLDGFESYRSDITP